MTVRWSPTALRDLESLRAYISADSPNSAAATVERILAGIDTLTRHPLIGRSGRIPGTRELIVTPYVVAYAIGKDAIEVLAVLLGAQRWPDAF